MIPTSIDGTDITGATIDGTDVTEITVDGQTVFSAEVELNGLLVDDFADGKLTNRDDFTTTPLNPSSLEPATSNTTVTTRPEYIDTLNSSVNASNELVHSNSFDNAYVLAQLPPFTGTHNITLTGSGQNIKNVMLASGSSISFESGAGSQPIPTNGYVLQMNDSGSAVIIRRSDNGSLTNLDRVNDSPNFPLEGSFDDSGNFTLEAANSTLSATDTTYNIDHIGIGYINLAAVDLTYSSFIVD
jgi:hypothetical protein